MLNKFRIGAKLLLVCLAIGIIPAAIMGISALWESRAALSRQAYSQLESMREVKKVQIEDFFADKRNDTQVLLNMVGNLRQNAWQKLQSVQENQIAQLEEYFQERLSDLRILANTEGVVHAVEQFSEAFELDMGEVGGMAWESIKGLLDKELQHYRETLGYQDLLLINQQGQVVYNTLQGEELGANLLQGELAETALGRGAQRVLEDRKMILQDLEAYPLADGKQVMFTLAPVFRYEKLVGALAFRLGIEDIANIVGRRKGMGRTGESYLAGRRNMQIAYRTDRNSSGEPGSTLGRPVDGEDINKALDGESGLMIKSGEKGQLLLSAYAPLHVPQLEWVLISVVEVEEILTPKLPGEDRDFFSQYIDQYGFYDLFLIHPDGQIFYSVRREAEYGTNILNGEYSDSQLAHAVKTAKRDRAFRISDYAPYAASNNMPSAFIAQPLLNEQQDVELVVALQLTDAALNRIMQQRVGMGRTGETYLVGGDKLMRSNVFLAPETHSIRNSFANPQEGQVDTFSALSALEGRTGRIQGTNYRGNQVLSAYTPIEVGQETWALIAEKHADEAFQAVNRLEWLLMGLAVVVIFGVWLLTRRFTHHLVSPLLEVNRGLKTLAEGKLTNMDIAYRGRDEIAELVESAQRLKEGMEATIAQANAVAAGNYEREVNLLSPHDQLGLALADMTRILREMSQENRQQDWLKNGIASLNEKMRGTQDLVVLARNVINFLAKYLEAQIGLFYVAKISPDGEVLKLVASYAFTRRKGLSDVYPVGEGIVGQAALEKELILLSEVPEDYIHIQSGAGDAPPRHLLVMPILYENQLKAVVELGSFHPFSELQVEFLRQAITGIGIGVYTAESRTQLQELLQQSQAQAEELQSQSEELQVQQEELRQSNEQLEERTKELERQKNAIRDKNEELEKTKNAIEEKARELELASKYKSEFLANMSHELRTPLNSLLILAQLLAGNKENNLSEKQVEYAQTIHHAGSDLLNLINEILDLSKIEAGKVDLHPEDFLPREWAKGFEQRFRHVAEEKGLEFEIQIAEELPEKLHNDSQRLQQVVTNLLSNAFKFTPRGGRITLEFSRPGPEEIPAGAAFTASNGLAIRVKDTGIGIPPDKQKLVFEAFQQADGSTSRKYGGTGLGLSISRQLVQLMGGEIRLHSVAEQGSTFSLIIPQRVMGGKSGNSSPSVFIPSREALAENRAARTGQAPSSETGPPPEAEEASAPDQAATLREAADSPPSPDLPPETEGGDDILPSSEAATEDGKPHAGPRPKDDRDNLQAGEHSLLIIEDDRTFSRLIMDLGREKGFKCLLAEDGVAGLKLAEEYRPGAIILDIGLPQADGWTVMEKLKSNSELRHIPVHCISGSDHGLDARKMGAIGYLLKPVGMNELGEAFKKLESFIENKMKNLLVVVAEDKHREAILKLMEGTGVEVMVADSPETAWSRLEQQEFDCIVLDAGSQPNGHLKLLEQLHHTDRLTQIPVILYAERDLEPEEETLLQHCTDNLILKEVRSPERLLDESTLFLHQVEASLPREQQRMLHMVHDKEAILTGKKVLLVDDDMRNIYSLTAILEEKGMEVHMAKNGLRALEALDQQPDMDLVLMDIMMPEMDGYEAMQKIRAQTRFRSLPIIALTAKAMKGDRAKCIEAGASDYLAKPIEVDKLLSLMRVWLYR